MAPRYHHAMGLKAALLATALFVLSQLGSTPVNAAPLPPELTMAFSPSTLIGSGEVTLIYTVRNPNPTPLTGITFLDDEPSWMQMLTPITGSCGGTKEIILVGPVRSLRLMGLNLAPFETCTISLSVSIGPTANETKTNSTGPISSTESGPAAGGASAQITLFLAARRYQELQ